MLDFIIQGFITLLLVWMAFWRKDIFLYLVAAPAAGMFGFAWYGRYATDAGLVVSICIIAVGIYSFWKVIENLIERIRG